jgi:uncharacterized phage-associated protein
MFCEEHMATSILQVAKTLGELSGFSLSNLELQKIGYIAEMLHLGRYHVPLIRENWEAWDYGPVCPALYKWAKMYGTSPVENMFPRMPTLPADTNEFQCVKDAFDMTRNLRPGQLINLTHQHDGAWAQYYDSRHRGVVIPKEAIAREYNVRITED